MSADDVAMCWAKLGCGAGAEANAKNMYENDGQKIAKTKKKKLETALSTARINPFDGVIIVSKLSGRIGERATVATLRHA